MKGWFGLSVRGLCTTEFDGTESVGRFFAGAKENCEISDASDVGL